MDDVALVFLGRDVLHSGSTGTALLYAGAGVGLFFGFLLVTKPRRWPPLSLFVGGLAVTAVGNLADWSRVGDLRRPARCRSCAGSV